MSRGNISFVVAGKWRSVAPCRRVMMALTFIFLGMGKFILQQVLAGTEEFPAMHTEERQSRQSIRKGQALLSCQFALLRTCQDNDGLDTDLDFLHPST